MIKTVVTCDRCNEQIHNNQFNPYNDKHLCRKCEELRVATDMLVKDLVTKMWDKFWNKETNDGRETKDA